MTQTSLIPAKVVPSSVPSLRAEGDVYTFPKKAWDFLRHYAVSLDEDAAMTEARVDRKHRSDILDNPHVKQEMARIQETYAYASRLTTTAVAGRHMKMMAGLEDDFSAEGVGKEQRAKTASVFAKMSDTAMKAVGLIGSTNPDQMPTVVMNINTGGGDANVQVNQSAKPAVTTEKV